MTHPPPLPRHLVVAPEILILLVSASGAVVGLLLVFAVSHGLPGWHCAWKAWTGLPCAGCGGTRAMAALCAGQWADALRLNPGVVAGSAFLGIANLYAAAVLLLRLPPWRPGWLSRGAWRWPLVAALVANWIYLLTAGAV